MVEIRSSWRARMVHAAQFWFVRDVLFPFLLTRLILLLIGGLAIELLPRDLAGGKWEYSTHFWINMWSRWDAGWYLTIAREGYAYSPSEASSVAFFPLYPLSIRFVSWLLRLTDEEGMLLSGILISNAALLVALGYLVALVRQICDERAAARSSLYLLLFPTSFFLSAVYSESLFLALTLAAFYYAEKRSWWLTGLMAGLSTTSRPLGCLILAPLIVMCLRQRHYRGLPALSFIPILASAYPLFLWRNFGDPLVFIKAQEQWGRQMENPWSSLLDVFSGPYVLHAPQHSILDLSCAVLLLVSLAFVWRNLPLPYALFTGLHLFAISTSGAWTSIMRFALTLFPLFIVLSVAGQRAWFDRAYIVISMNLLAIFTAMFALWYWVG